MNNGNLINVTNFISRVNNGPFKTGSFISNVQRKIENGKTPDIVASFKKQLMVVMKGPYWEEVYGELMKLEDDSRYRKIVEDAMERGQVHRSMNPTTNRRRFYVLPSIHGDDWMLPLQNAVLAALRTSPAIKIASHTGYVIVTRDREKRKWYVIENKIDDDFVMKVVNTVCGVNINDVVSKEAVNSLINRNVKKAIRLGVKAPEGDIREAFSNPPVLKIGNYIEWVNEDVSW